MANQLNLCSVQELDKSYEHVLDFNSKTTQLNFFNKKTIKQIDYDFKGDGFRLELTVPATLEEVLKVDYLFFKGDDGKYYFYFVDDKEFKTQDVTILHLTLDVFNTYSFDFEVLHSFVERCHVNRWKTKGKIPNEEQVVDEGFPEFQSVIGKKSVINQMPDGCYIYASTQPLGTGITQRPNGVGGGGNDYETVTTGLISKQGFRYIKGWEAFTPTGCYLGGESFRTVGYGSTEKYNLNYYEKHKPFPCSEKLASEIYAERIINEFGSRIYNAILEAGILFKVSHNMFDAMCSLAYNRGINGFLNDDTSPWQTIKIDPRNFEQIRFEWEKYAVTASGVPSTGLVNRRKSEMNVYQYGDYEKRSIGIYSVDSNGCGYLNGYVKDNNGDGFIPDYLPDATEPMTKKVIMDADGNAWVQPTSGKITAGFPNYPESFGGGYHGGVDFANSLDTPIYASGDGVIHTKQTWNGNENTQPYGNLLIIEQEGNKTKQTYRTYYAHLNSFAPGLAEGMRVSKGQLIGYMGSTGKSTGSHLHYEQRVYPYSPQVDTAIHPAKNLSLNEEV